MFLWVLKTIALKDVSVIKVPALNIIKYQYTFENNYYIVIEAQQRLIELEAEKQRLDDELTRAQIKISVSEKAVASLTIVDSVIFYAIYIYNNLL